MRRGWDALAAGSALCGAGMLAYAVRGRSSDWFGPSVYRGPANRRAVALTFDDGPSESTPALLEILAPYRAPATFFQCGANIRRLPAIAREVAQARHEIGNHSDTHCPLYLQSAGLIYNEFERAQRTIEQELGIRASLLRAPFGARWFGFRAMQQTLGLRGVMWTVIGRDWALNGAAVAQRVFDSARNGALNGAIVCLHDGRELAAQPDVRATLEAVRQILPELANQGYEFLTVSQLLGL